MSRCGGAVERVRLGFVRCSLGESTPTEQRNPTLTVAERDANVLIVDDEPKFRQLIARLLEKRGFVVSQAEHGLEAVHLIEHGLAVDVIILDERMPHLTGTETFRYLRSRGVQTPMVLVSAMDDLYTTAQVNGFDGALQKPVSVDMLAGLLQTLVDQQRNEAARNREAKPHEKESPE